MTELDGLHFTPDPYHRRTYSTDGLLAAIGSALGSVRAAEAMRVALGFDAMGVAKLSRTLARLRGKLRRVVAHNLRTERKHAMLDDPEWRARVRAELGGDRAIARWHRAWARLRDGVGPERGGRLRASDKTTTRRPVATRDARCEFRLAPVGRSNWKAKSWSRVEAAVPREPRTYNRQGSASAVHPWGRAAIAVWPSELDGHSGPGVEPLEVLYRNYPAPPPVLDAERKASGPNTEAEGGHIGPAVRHRCHADLQDVVDRFVRIAEACDQQIHAECESAPRGVTRCGVDQTGLSSRSRPAGWAVLADPSAALILPERAPP